MNVVFVEPFFPSNQRNFPRALAEALSSDRPVVVEAMVDPEVPPLPPHITMEQAKHFAEAIAKFDPDTPHMVRQSWRDWLSGKRGNL